MSPLVSVVIPTCNRSRMLPRALHSAAGQSLRDLEIIVVDDCSDDETQEVVNTFGDKRVRSVRRTARGGGAAARNDGIRLARGDFVAFLDDDDEWLPDKLTRQLEIFERNPQAGLVYTGAFHLRQRDRRLLKIVVPERRGQVYRDLLRENFIRTTSSIMVRRDVFQVVGLFDQALPACQDWDLCLRIARNFTVDFVAEPLLRFYIHPVRITHDLTARIRGKERIFQKYLEDISRDAKILGKHCSVLGRLYCHNGQLGQGRRYLRRALRYTPFDAAAWKFMLLSLVGSIGYGTLLKIKRKAGFASPSRLFSPGRKNHESDPE